MINSSINIDMIGLLKITANRVLESSLALFTLFNHFNSKPVMLIRCSIFSALLIVYSAVGVVCSATENDNDSASLMPYYSWGRGITFPVADLTLGGYINSSFAQEHKLKSYGAIDDLSLFITWSPHERVRFFSEIELEEWLSSYGVIDNIYDAFRVERLYTDLLITETLNLRLGKFLTPVGRWNVIHAGPLVWTTTRPIISEKMYTPEHISGVLLSKKLELLEHSVEFSIYYDNAQQLDPHQEDLETDNAFGGRMTIDLAEQLQLGVSYLNFKEATDDDELQLARIDNIGLDLLWQQNDYELLMEFIYHHADDIQGDKKGLYLQGVAPLFDHVFAVGRYEYLTDNHKLIQDNAHIGIIGLAWRPYTPLVFKAEYRLGEHNEFIAPEGFFTSIAVFF